MKLRSISFVGSLFIVLECMVSPYCITVSAATLYAVTFDTDGNFEGWADFRNRGNAIVSGSAVNFNTTSTQDVQFRTAGDAYNPLGAGIDSSLYPGLLLIVRIKQGTVAGDIVNMWVRDTEYDGADAENMVAANEVALPPVTLAADDTYKIVVRDIKSIVDGFADGILRAIRIDPQFSANTSSIDYILITDGISESPPQFLSGPNDIRVSRGQDATFTVNFDSNMPVVSCVWYRWIYGNDYYDTPLSDSHDYDIAWTQNDSSLTILDAHVYDLGRYYCIITTYDSGQAYSNPASLDLIDLVTYYTMDGTFSDASGYGYHGYVSDLNPNWWTSGLLGNAFDVDGLNSLEIPRSANDNFTLSVWIKTTQSDCNLLGTLDDLGLDLCDGGVRYGIQNQILSSNVDVNDNQWHLITATRMADSGKMALYIDGTLQFDGIGPTGPLPDPPTSPPSGVDFVGLIDEIKTYNYVRNPSQIAEEYVGVLGGLACPEYFFFDTDKSCQVDYPDLGDFASQWLDTYDFEDYVQFALDWLKCTIYPDCY